MKYLLALGFLLTPVVQAQQPIFHVLAFYSETVERDHLDFAHQAIKFYAAAAQRDHFNFVSTANWDDLNIANLAHDELILWLDDQPHTAQQRAAFEEYMKYGGGWLGFHIAAYNDSDTQWPWFIGFLGGGVFYGNNWPPLPAVLTVDDRSHPITKNLPGAFLSPPNEWCIWRPSPRLNRYVKVLLTLSRSNYPLGFKDTLEGGDLPVVWTNTQYRMPYINMGHGDKIFAGDIQNHFFEDAILWVGALPVKPQR
jgi:hypothetical protein